MARFKPQLLLSLLLISGCAAATPTAPSATGKQTGTEPSQPFPSAAPSAAASAPAAPDVIPPLAERPQDMVPTPIISASAPLPAATGTPLAQPTDSPVKPSPTLTPAPAAYRENFFKNYGVNPFVEASTDPLSTFAADVDTAAYTLMRAFLKQNKLPDPAAVRTEEYLNFFDYRYTQPASGAFAIQTEIAPSYFGDPNSHLLRIGIQGREIMDRNRKPALLTFVIDVSGSMNLQNRLELVKRSLKLLVAQLKPRDQVALVIFGQRARTILPHTPGTEKAQILAAIDTLRPEGATDTESGLSAGYREARTAFEADAINRIILCSDGVANLGETDQAVLLDKIKREAAAGLALSSVGFGLGNFNDTLLEQLANQGNGTYAYVDTLAEARRIFSENLTGTLQTIARDVKIQVAFNPAVVSQYRLLGYENRDIADSDFRNDQVDAGEVGSGHSVTALYELRFVAQSDASALGSVSVRYQEPDSQTPAIRELTHPLQTTELKSFRQTSPAFKLATAVAEYAEILRDSPFARDGQLSEVAALLEQVQQNWPDDASVKELAGLVSQAEKLKNPTTPAPTASSQLPDWSAFLRQQLGQTGG